MSAREETSPFVFQDRFLVNHPQLDEQHQGLFKLINEVYFANKRKLQKPEIQKALENLRTATVAHFRAEEEVMVAMNFEDLQTHKHVHQSMLFKLGKIIEEFAQPRATLPMDTMAFFNEWLSRHILVLDQKYAKKLAAIRAANEKAVATQSK